MPIQASALVRGSSVLVTAAATVAMLATPAETTEAEAHGGQPSDGRGAETRQIASSALDADENVKFTLTAIRSTVDPLRASVRLKAFAPAARPTRTVGRGTGRCSGQLVLVPGHRAGRDLRVLDGEHQPRARHHEPADHPGNRLLAARALRAAGREVQGRQPQRADPARRSEHRRWRHGPTNHHPESTGRHIGRYPRTGSRRPPSRPGTPCATSPMAGGVALPRSRGTTRS